MMLSENVRKHMLYVLIRIASVNLASFHIICIVHVLYCTVLLLFFFFL